MIGFDSGIGNGLQAKKIAPVRPTTPRKGTTKKKENDVMVKGYKRAEATSLRLLRRREVEARTGLSRSSIYARMADGTFPLAVYLGGRAVAWVESEIDSWVMARIAARASQA